MQPRVFAGVTPVATMSLDEFGAGKCALDTRKPKRIETATNGLNRALKNPEVRRLKLQLRPRWAALVARWAHNPKGRKVQSCPRSQFLKPSFDAPSAPHAAIGFNPPNPLRCTLPSAPCAQTPH